MGSGRGDPTPPITDASVFQAPYPFTAWRSKTWIRPCMMPVANLGFCEEEAKQRRAFPFSSPSLPPILSPFPSPRPLPFSLPFLSSLDLHFSPPFPSSRLRIAHQIQGSAVACKIPQRTAMAFLWHSELKKCVWWQLYRVVLCAAAKCCT